MFPPAQSIVRPALFAALFAATLAPLPALAHRNSVTPLALRVEGREVTATARVESLDLNETVGLPSWEFVSLPDALARSREAGRYLTARLRVANAGRPCVPSAPEAAVVARGEQWFLALTVRYACPHRVESLAVDYDLFFDVDRMHRGITSLEGLGPPRQFVFQYDRRRWEIAAAVPLRRQLGQYLLLGVEHIFAGYDHVAFVVALLVLAGPLGRRAAARHVLAVVSSFTLAHSLTLVAAALGWVSAPARVVEPVIAVSIVHVAASNLRGATGPSRWRPLYTFAFGLVHGLGFADVLRGTGLPARATVTSLLMFNVGVELGQLAVVAAVLPLLLAMASGRPLPAQLAWAIVVGALATALLPRLGPPRPTVLAVAVVAVVLVLAARRWGYDRSVRVGLSAALCGLAALWALERLLSKTFFSGALG